MLTHYIFFKTDTAKRINSNIFIRNVKAFILRLIYLGIAYLTYVFVWLVDRGAGIFLFIIIWKAALKLHKVVHLWSSCVLVVIAWNLVLALPTFSDCCRRRYVVKTFMLAFCSAFACPLFLDYASIPAHSVELLSLRCANNTLLLFNGLIDLVLGK